MAAHVVFSNFIRDPLKAKIMHQPVEQRRRVVLFNCGTQIPITKLIEQIKGASETADLVDQANGMIKRSGIEID